MTTQVQLSIVHNQNHKMDGGIQDDSGNTPRGSHYSFGLFLWLPSCYNYNVDAALKYGKIKLSSTQIYMSPLGNYSKAQ